MGWKKNLHCYRSPSLCRQFQAKRTREQEKATFINCDFIFLDIHKLHTYKAAKEELFPRHLTIVLQKEKE